MVALNGLHSLSPQISECLSYQHGTAQVVNSQSRGEGTCKQFGAAPVYDFVPAIQPAMRTFLYPQQIRSSKDTYEHL